MIPHIVLKKTDTNADTNTVLGADYEGDYQIGCTAYAADVTLQWRPRSETGETDHAWLPAFLQTSSGAVAIRLTRAGAVLDITLIKDFDYRFITASAGSEVVMGKHDRSGGTQ